jgi:hypothetical protein
MQVYYAPPTWIELTTELTTHGATFNLESRQPAPADRASHLCQRVMATAGIRCTTGELAMTNQSDQKNDKANQQTGQQGNKGGQQGQQQQSNPGQGQQGNNPSQGGQQHKTGSDR